MKVAHDKIKMYVLNFLETLKITEGGTYDKPIVMIKWNNNNNQSKSRQKKGKMNNDLLP